MFSINFFVRDSLLLSTNLTYTNLTYTILGCHMVANFFTI